jgi:dolichol-phosphate mannosyltransferase
MYLFLNKWYYELIMCCENKVYISVVSPAYNEDANLPYLVDQVEQAMATHEKSWEFIIVDDGSKDNSLTVLKSLMAQKPFLRVISLLSNSGQSAAIEAGIRNAHGQLIVTLDSDLQNDPAEIPKMVRLIVEEKCDFVNGWRHRRNDPWIRLMSTKIANGVRNWLTKESIHDSACGLKVFRRECFENMRLFRGMHRFLPTLAKIQGYSVLEVEVNHRPRIAGTAKYGVWNRVFCALKDTFAVRWMASRIVNYQSSEITKNETTKKNGRENQ